MTPLLPEGATQWGGRPVARTVAEAAPRCRVILTGTVRSVAIRRGRTFGGPLLVSKPSPYVDAELDDGTGNITLRWLGRVWVHGVSCGTPLEVEGTALTDHHHLVVVNPFYSLL